MRGRSKKVKKLCAAVHPQQKQKQKNQQGGKVKS
jgi:hypothetical protein